MTRQPVLPAAILAATLFAPATASSADAPKALTPSRAELLNQGQQIAQAKCSACHGLDGMSLVAANPNIAGMPEQYIASQLALFKSGERKNAIMAGMVADMDAAAMRAVGAYYFAQRGKPNAAARDVDKAALGQKIYRAGIADRKVPACAGCHGATGAGIPASYPRLAGQWPEYTFAELTQYASGERKHPVMRAIAERMTEGERRAVAEYIAGLRSR
jgi:cytochrome c553